jgi:hypothetical protein
MTDQEQQQDQTQERTQEQVQTQEQIYTPVASDSDNLIQQIAFTNQIK